MWFRGEAQQPSRVMWFRGEVRQPDSVVWFRGAGRKNPLQGVQGVRG